MARTGTSSTTLPLNFPLLSLKQGRNKNMITSSIHFSNAHLQKLKISHQSSKLSGFKSDGFTGYSLANDEYSVDDGIEEINNNSEEPSQVKSW